MTNRAPQECRSFAPQANVCSPFGTDTTSSPRAGFLLWAKFKGLGEVLFSAQIRPSCALMICCEMLRPRPEFWPKAPGRSV